MKKCIKCGREILDRAKICPYCSKEQISSSNENREEVTENKEPINTEEMPEKTVILRKSSLQKEKLNKEEPEQKLQQEEKFQDENITENKQKRVNPRIRYCSKCGAEVRASGRFCWKCGTPLPQENMDTKKPDTKKENNDKTDTVGNTIADIGDKIAEAGEKIKQNPKGILKIYCLLMAISYGCFAFYDIQYITFYYNNAIWSLLKVLAESWIAFLFAVIGLRCQKEYGKNLVYALFAGTAVKCILHIHNIYENSKYYVNSSLDIYAIIIIVIEVVICYYLMKKNGFIVSRESDTVTQILRDFPWALRQTLSNGEKGDRQRPQQKEKEVKVTVDISLPQGKLQAVLVSKEFLIFAVIYTANLVANVFTDFSVSKIFFQIFPILFCTGIWMIYCNRYKETMSTSGFSLINVVFVFELVIRIIALVLAVIAAFSIGSDGGVAVFFLSAIIIGLDIGYWRSLILTISSMKECAVHGTGYVEMHASWYPIVIWVVQTIIKGIGFWIACSMQSFANNVNMTLNQYGEEANSIAGYFTNSLGLGYGLGYGTSSDLVNSLLSPVTSWIQNTFGFSQSPVMMLLAIAIPVISIVLFFKMRSYD